MSQVEIYYFGKMIFLSVILAFGFVLSGVHGHGMMLDPPNRSSLWRFNESFPINYNDNENFCGGFGVSIFPVKLFDYLRVCLGNSVLKLFF